MSYSSGLSSPRSSISESFLDLNDNYDVRRHLGGGKYSKIVLGICKKTGNEVALKLLPKETTSQKDFLREFKYSYFLSPHLSILNTFNVTFETAEHYVFAQEYAPLGDLFDHVTPHVGLPERIAKNVMRQIVSALEFMHSKHLVHRDIKPENVLVFDHECMRVKLMDFGLTRKTGTMIRKTDNCNLLPYTAPEVCDAVVKERYSIETSADVWGLGVFLYSILTGRFPWEQSTESDKSYNMFCQWQRRKMHKPPTEWRATFTDRVLRLFRRLLEPKVDKRCKVKEVKKYIEDAWLLRCRSRSLVTEEFFNKAREEEGESSSQVSRTLQMYGVDTKVSRKGKHRRIADWLLSF